MRREATRTAEEASTGADSISSTHSEITADQESYIDTLLEQYNMTNCNPLIGELMFVAINTQPLIAHSVNGLARFMSNTNHEFYILAKGVLRYLAGHSSQTYLVRTACQIPISSLRTLCVCRFQLGGCCFISQKLSMLSGFL